MRIRYIPFFTENMEKQVNFFTDTLKFKVLGKTSLFNNHEATLVQTDDAENILAVIQKRGFDNNKNCVVLNTDDCLKEYHMLKADGLIFTKEPHYMPMGLVAEFNDQFSNKFILLEERNYNDDL